MAKKDKPISKTTTGKGRHYLKASEGAGMTEAGRAAYNKATRRPTRSMGTQTELAKKIRSIALRNSEQKHNFIQSENVQLYHNTATVVDQLLQTTVGTSQLTRTGDEVIGQYLKIKFWLSNKNDRPNVMYRIILFSTPLTSQVLAWATNTSSNRMIATLDTDKIKILRQKLIRTQANDYSLEPSASNKERSQLYTMNYYLKNRKIKYQADGGGTVLWQGNNIHIAVIPYDAYGTQITDNIASLAYQVSFYFKDP